MKAYYWLCPINEKFYKISRVYINSYYEINVMGYLRDGDDALIEMGVPCPELLDKKGVITIDDDDQVAILKYLCKKYPRNIIIKEEDKEDKRCENVLFW